MGNLLTEWTQFTLLVIYFLPISLATFSSYNAIANEAHFVLEHPLYNHIRVKFPTIF